MIAIKIYIRDLIKSIVIFIIRKMPKVLQIYPIEILRKNEININNVKIIFRPSNDHAYRRWKAFEKNGKEKNTFDWINNFEQNNVFFDIGANIGVFSIYSAMKKGMKVFAFEPEPNSFIDLFRTIELNNCDVTPMLMPLSNKNDMNFFNLKNTFDTGGSGHRFGKKDSTKKNFGIISHTLDELISLKKIPDPNYIKMDVDGLEKSVLEGMENLFESKNLKSLLVEFTLPEDINFYKKHLEKFNLKLVQGPTGNNRNYIFSKMNK
jgi:FkbM family methyltransferase